MKVQYPLLITLGLTLILFSFINVISIDQAGSFKEGKRIIVLRKVGHEILLNVGDSTSRVLPVQEIRKDKFQLQFENSFSFEPDSIIQIIDRTFVSNGIEQDYIVNVLECRSDKIIYGYAIMASQQKDIVPCSGRQQPTNCYYVNIAFDDTPKNILHTKGIRVGTATLGFLLLVFGVFKYQKSYNNIGNVEARTNGADQKIELGNFIFNPNEDYLVLNEHKMKLTAKESKLLSVFASRPNQVIEREELQQRVWGDEGVVVGRSLDIFISKLRKKLSEDPNVTLLNVFGKGYKLVTVP